MYTKNCRVNWVGFFLHILLVEAILQSHCFNLVSNDVFIPFWYSFGTFDIPGIPKMKQKEDMNNVTNLKNDRIFIKEGLTKYLSCSVVFCGWAQQNKCENSSSLIAVTKKINYLKASRWNTQEFIFAFLFHFRKGIENCQLKVMKNCWQLTMIDFFIVYWTEYFNTNMFMAFGVNIWYFVWNSQGALKFVFVFDACYLY